MFLVAALTLLSSPGSDDGMLVTFNHEYASTQAKQGDKSRIDQPMSSSNVDRQHEMKDEKMDSRKEKSSGEPAKLGIVRTLKG